MYDVFIHIFSNRLGCLFDQLEKAWPNPESGKPEEKEFEQVRYITNKMQQLLSSQGNIFNMTIQLYLASATVHLQLNSVAVSLRH